MPKKKQPVAFLSYARVDDQYEEGRITEFCKRLSSEVRMQTGEDFPIFQDRNDIQWGQNWKERVDESLDEVTFLLPIITPSFFNSTACRAEMKDFLRREKKLKRNDLILPVYYVGSPLLDEETERAKDKLAQVIASRQYADWRELRFESATSDRVRKMFAQLAVQVRDALARRPAPRGTAKKPVSPGTGVRPRRHTKKGVVGGQTGKELVPTAESGGLAAPAFEETRGPTAKTEPPTLVVDPLHRGDYPTISEAIEAAGAGDRILVRPGLYQEGLIIDKPLELIGQGDASDVVVRATGKNALLFKATMGRVTNLTLRQAGPGNYFGVDIAQGRLELEGCDISSESLSCVAIHAGADPRLRRNRIHDGTQGGVFVYDSGLGTLEENEIFGNALSGVSIATGANPTLQRNRIHEGKSGGVFVLDSGLGTLEDNEIFGNALAGVSIKTGANPTFRRNRIHEGKAGGVFMYDSGLGTLEDNEIFGNAFAGVEIRTAANPTLRRNRIHDGKQAGVNVHDSGLGTLEDNEIFGNPLSGVAIRTGANPTLRRNRIHDGKQAGVNVHDSGLGTLEDNEIFGNAFAGVEIRTGANPTLRRNRIHDGKQAGVHVHDSGLGTLEENEIFGNALVGVSSRAGANPTVRRNRINKNGYEAVWVHDLGGGTFEDNDLRDNAKGAWDIAQDSASIVKRARNLE